MDNRHWPGVGIITMFLRRRLSLFSVVVEVSLQHATVLAVS